MLKLENMIAPDTTLECNGKCYTFRAMDLGDKIWLLQEYGENTEKLLKAGDLGIVARVAYRLLVDKSQYAPKNVSDYDENGNKTTFSIGGVKLFCSEFKSNASIKILTNALADAMMAGEPVSEETKKEDIKSEGESPLA